jgi:hypothetical protein
MASGETLVAEIRFRESWSCMLLFYKEFPFFLRKVNSLRAPSNDANQKGNQHIKQQALTRT